jgi:hypothetical protein
MGVMVNFMSTLYPFNYQKSEKVVVKTPLFMVSLPENRFDTVV